VTRLFGSLALLLLAACATVAPYHSCPGPCGGGLTCDTSIGECRIDPCQGRCTAHERCAEGPPPHCEIVPMPEMEVTHPDTSSPAGMLH
jgi:hypothetical protein